MYKLAIIVQIYKMAKGLSWGGVVARFLNKSGKSHVNPPP